MHPETLTNWLTTLSGRKPSSLLYSEDTLLGGRRITLRAPLDGRMLEQISSMHFQTDGTNFDTEWKWNIVSEEVEKTFGNFYTVSIKLLTKAGPTNWMVMRPPNKTQNETLKHDKEEKNTSTFRWKDLDLDTCKKSTRISAGKPERYLEKLLNPNTSNRSVFSSLL